MMSLVSMQTDMLEFENEVSAYSTPEINKNLFIDRYLTMSALQKAIRRKNLSLVLDMGHLLRETHPKIFWQRLQITALEDIGLANRELVSRVLTVASRPHDWGVVGGIEKVACFLIESMCMSRKDRSTDDLFDVISRDPKCANICMELAEFNENTSSTPEFSDDVFGRALSLIPPKQRNGEISGRLRRPEEWVYKMEQADFACPISLVSLAGRAALETRSILAPMLLALAEYYPEESVETDDELLPELWYRGVPTWACGQHTRVGLAGLRKFAVQSKRVSKILSLGKTGEISSSKVLGGLLFRFECGQIKRKVEWSLGAELKTKATDLGWGLRDECVPDLLDAMIAEWDHLNECRLSALKNYLR